MKNLRIFRISFFSVILVFLFITFAFAKIYEYPRLYTDIKTVGRGGVGIALPSGSASVFYNPAVLSQIPKGYYIDILRLSVGSSKKSLDFINDLSDALDEDNNTETAIMDVLNKYIGETFSGEADILSSLFINRKPLGLILGVFGRSRVSGIVHQGFGSAGLLDVKIQNYAGMFLGGYYSFYNRRIHLGGDLKVIGGAVLDHQFTTYELLNHADNFTDYLIDDLLNYGTGVVGDVGLVFTPFPQSRLNPAIGISVLNIPGLKLNGTEVIPMTVNLGFSISPKLLDKPYLNKARFGIDVIDILKKYKEDQDWGKRLYMGGELSVIDAKFLKLWVRGGFYQGYPAGGATLKIFILELNFATYAEEVGAYAGQYENRIYLGSLSINW